MYDRDQLFIDGKWAAGRGDSVITVISPHSEAEIGRAACAGTADVDRAVQAARACGQLIQKQGALRAEAIKNGLSARAWDNRAN